MAKTVFILMRLQVKILLLGSGESGKSTFIKQMVIIHGKGEFTADEVRAYRQQIYQVGLCFWVAGNSNLNIFFRFF